MRYPSIITLLMLCAVLACGHAHAQAGSPSADDTLSVERLVTVLGKGVLREPLGMAVDDRGFILVADAMAGKVYRFSPGDAGFYPIDVAAHGTQVYVLDYAGNRILRYEYKGAWLDVLLEFSQFGGMRPASLTSSPGGKMLTTDLEKNTLTVWSPLLEIEIVTGDYGIGDGNFDRPAKAALFGDEEIAVAEFGNSRVQLFGGAGRFEGYAELRGGASWTSPRYVCGGLDGYLFAVDTGAGLVHAFSPGGKHVLTVGAGAGIKPSAAAASWDEHLYIADLNSRSILVYRVHYPGR